MVRLLAFIVLSGYFGNIVVESQQCGRPKSFDVIALSQQFANPRRKRDMPGHRPDLSAHVHRRDQTVIPPWSADFDKFKGDKIVGGYDVQDPTGGQICWQVGIIIGTAEGYFNCGGSIIGSITIVTAAHCCLNRRGAVRSPTEFTIILGALDGGFDGSNANEGATNCGRSFKVSKVTVNSQYNWNTNNNDIALLTLSSAINFNTTCACPICLLSKTPAVGEWAATSGYGDVTESGVGDPDPIPLRFVYIQVLANRRPLCAIDTGMNTTLFVCAGNIVGQDSCQGDSGGPLFAWDNTRLHSYYLAGLTSTGNGCARGTGAQYTKVQPYLTWIIQNAQESITVSF